MSSTRLFGAALAASALLGACSDSSGPSANSVAFQVATAAAVPGAAARIPDATNGDKIEFTSVKVVLHKIELGLESSPTCLPDTDTDDCEELEIGPLTVDLPTDPGAQREFAVTVPDGSYDKVEFKLAPDPATGCSVVVSGTYTPNGGSASTFTDVCFNVDAEQEFEFTTPITIPNDAGAAVTVFVDLAQWFADGSGGYLDPSDPANESEVENNVQNSFDVFEDNDHDGDDDHGSD